MAKTPVAWVIGAGSGIGAATAVSLAESGHSVVLSGRRLEALEDTLEEVRRTGGRALIEQLDATDPHAVDGTAGRITSELGPVTTLVFAAGTNVQQRWWDKLTAADFRHVVDVNLNSAVNCVTAVLPQMREVGQGNIFIFGSWAGWRYMSVASAAYTASKAGLSGVVETLNDQEGRSGIRATLVVPGEVETVMTRDRPNPLPDADLANMIRPEDVAGLISHLAALPRHVCVNEIVISGILNGIYLRDTAFHGPVLIDGASRPAGED